MHKVVIGSRNPVKIECTKIGFEQVFSSEQFDIKGIAVPSGVSDQPMTDDETLQGAMNRAQACKKSEPNADYWIGIEGGIEETEEDMLAFAWVVILSANQSGKSRTSTFSLPPKVADLIRSGVELGVANDQVFGEKNSKQKGGAVGSLTNGVLDRTEYYVQPVMLALVPFLNPEIY